MNVALDHSGLVHEAARAMDGERDRQRAGNEPRGFLPRLGTKPPPWRRVKNWIFGDRADIDQEGLLAERTLMMAPRPPRHEAPRADPDARDGSGDASA
jgi:hypothetical protein